MTMIERLPESLLNGCSTTRNQKLVVKMNTTSILHTCLYMDHACRSSEFAIIRWEPDKLCADMLCADMLWAPISDADEGGTEARPDILRPWPAEAMGGAPGWEEPMRCISHSGVGITLFIVMASWNVEFDHLQLFHKRSLVPNVETKETKSLFNV